MAGIGLTDRILDRVNLKFIPRGARKYLAYGGIGAACVGGAAYAYDGNFRDIHVHPESIPVYALGAGLLAAGAAGLARRGIYNAEKREKGTERKITIEGGFGIEYLEARYAQSRVRKINEGGMGCIFGVTDSTNGLERVHKYPLREVLESEDVLTRFRNEFRIMARLAKRIPDSVVSAFDIKEISPGTYVQWMIKYGELEQSKKESLLGSYEFSAKLGGISDFKDLSAVSALYQAMSADLAGITFTTHDGTLERLNEVIRLPYLYDLLFNKGKIATATLTPGNGGAVKDDRRTTEQ